VAPSPGAGLELAPPTAHPVFPSVFRTRFLLQATVASRAVRVFQALVYAGDFRFHVELMWRTECRTVGVQ